MLPCLFETEGGDNVKSQRSRKIPENRHSTCKGSVTRRLHFASFIVLCQAEDTNSNIGLLALCQFLVESDLVHLSKQILPHYLLSRLLIVGRVQWWARMYGQNRSLLLVSFHAHWQPKIVRQTARLQMEYFAALVISVYEKLDGMLKGTQCSGKADWAAQTFTVLKSSWGVLTVILLQILTNSHWVGNTKVVIGYCTIVVYSHYYTNPSAYHCKLKWFLKHVPLHSYK